MKMSTRDMTNAGLLVAMSVILTRFASFMLAGNTIRVSFGTIPIYVAGLLFGPFLGGTVGAVADLVGYLFNSFGSAFIPHIFLASVMRGIVPPLVVRAIGNNGRNWHAKVLAAIIGTEIVSGAILTTWGLAWIRQMPFMVLLPPRLIALAVQIPLYSAATYALTVALRSFRASHQVGR